MTDQPHTREELTPERIAELFTTSPEHRAAFLRAAADDSTMATFRRLHGALERFALVLGEHVRDMAAECGRMMAAGWIGGVHVTEPRPGRPWRIRAAVAARSGHRPTVRNAQWHKRARRLSGRRPGRLVRHAR